MQEDADIKISMLLDGELKSREALNILNRIRNESLVRAKWMRYNVVSCALKEKAKVFPDTGFCDRVSKALEQEVLFVAAKTSLRKFPLRNPLIATALAASIAAIGVMVWTGFPYSPSPSDSRSNQAGLFLSSQSGNARVLPSKSEPAHRPALPNRLNDYLITHNESTYTTGTQTMMPYAQVISYRYDR